MKKTTKATGKTTPKPAAKKASKPAAKKAAKPAAKKAVRTAAKPAAKKVAKATAKPAVPTRLANAKKATMQTIKGSVLTRGQEVMNQVDGVKKIPVPPRPKRPEDLNLNVKRLRGK